MQVLDQRHTEKELVNGCLKGKPSFQKELFDRFSPKMMGVAIRYLSDPDAAEDVLLKAFTRVFNKLNSFRFEGSLEGWIRKIVVNESLAQIRSEGASKWKVSLEEVDSEIGTAADIYEQLSTQDLMEIIRSLPLGYRTVFNLFAIEGYGHKEIAQKLNISEGTSKSQYLRARALLQKKIVGAESTHKISDYGS